MAKPVRVTVYPIGHNPKPKKGTRYWTGWIPCKKEMPKKSGKYMVTVNINGIHRYVDIVHYCRDTNNWMRDSANHDVIAWAPVHATYKG